MDKVPSIYSFLTESAKDEALKKYLKEPQTIEKWNSIGLDGFKWETQSGEERTVDTNNYLSMQQFLRHACGIIADKNYSKYQTAIARLWTEMMIEKNPDKEASFEQNVKSILKHIPNSDDDNFDLSGKPMNQLLSEYNQKIKSANDEVLNRIKGKVYDSNTEYKVIEINNFKEAQEYYKYVNDLNIPWCVTESENNFNGYSSGGANRIYFALKNGFEKLRKPEQTEDSPYDEYGMSMMFIAIAPSGMINNITSRWNHDASTANNNSKWSGWGNSDSHYFESPDGEFDTDLLSKMFGKNFYELCKPKTWEDVVKTFEMSEDTDDDVSFYVKYNNNDDCILIDKNTDEPLFKEVFDYCGDFHEGFTRILKNEKWNFINKEGKFISNEWFDGCSNFDEGFASVKKDRRWYFINQEGKLISNEWFDDCLNFHEGFAKVLKDKKWYFINKEGNFISNEWFDWCENFKEGLAVVTKDYQSNFINQEGKLISNEWFDSCDNFNEGFAKVRKDGEWNFINKEGKLISNKWFDFDYCNDFKEGFARVKKNNEYNFINKEGKLISNKWFDWCDNFNKGFAMVGKDGKWYKIDAQGNFVNESKQITSKHVPLFEEFINNKKAR